MPISRIFTSRTFLFLAVFALISSPALAQLSLSTNALTFVWSPGTPIPFGSQPVTVTSDAAFDVSVTSTPASLFQFTKSGNVVSVSVNWNLASQLSLAAGEYTGTLTVQSGSLTQTVSLKFVKGSVGLTVGAISPFVAPAGSTVPQSQSVSVSATAGGVPYTVSVSTASGANWLSVSPVSGTLPATLSITASPSGLAVGTHTGTVTVNAGGASSSINVSLIVGGGNGAVTASPAAMSFAYMTGSSVAPAPQQLTVYASSLAYVTATASTTSGTNWLQVSGGGFSLGAGQSAYLQVGVSPLGLAAGTYYGTVTVSADGVAQSWVQVTLNVNSNTGVSVTPTTLSFSSPGGSTAQTVTVSYSGSQPGLTYTAQSSSTGWLSVSPTSGSVNGYFYVSVNPTGLTTGTYTGYVTVSVPGESYTQSISVSLAVGGGGGAAAFGVGPTALTFNAQSGVTPPSQPIAVHGPSNQYFTASASTSSGVQWLVLNATSGVTPATLSVSVNPALVPAGAHTGTIQVSSGGSTGLVNVTLNVQAAPVLVANPGGFVVTYDPSAGAVSPQYVSLSSSANATTHFTYTAASSAWLGVYPASGATDSTDPRFAILPTVSNLSPGVNSGSVTVTGTARNGGATTQTVIPFTVIVTGSATGSLVFSPTAVTFTANQGVAPAAQTISVTSATAGTIFTVSPTTTSGGNWLVVSPATGWTNSNLTVTANSAALLPGTYTGSINVTSNSVTQQIPVTLTVGAVAGGTLSVDNVPLSFDYQQGGAIPGPISLQVTSSGSQIAVNAYTTVSGMESWLNVSPRSGSTPVALSVSVNPENLAPGDYTGTITITSAAATNSPQTRTVTLKVRPSAALSLSTNTMTFTSRDGAVPASQTFTVSSSGSAVGFSVSASNAPWLTVSPATGTTPATLSVSVNPAGLAARTYTGQIVVQGTGGNSSRQTIDVTLVVSAPLPTITRVTNAASYRDGAVSPGELVVLFGSFMGPKDLVTLKVDSAGRVMKNLSDVRVLFSGVEAPVVYASADQVSAIVPYSMAGRATTSVQVDYRGIRSNSITLDVATTAPGIFTMNSSGNGAGVVLNQDYSLNSAANGAARGSVIIVYATGEGQTVPFGVDGGVNNDPNLLPAPVATVTASIDGLPANVLYAGAAPGMVSGVLQLNIEVPFSSGAGNVPLVISAGGASSQPNVTVSVK